MDDILSKFDAKVEYFDQTRNNFPGGERYVVTFDYGYGASIVCNEASFGGKSGFWELAVLHKSINDKDYDLCYRTWITNDVIGWLKPEDVGKLVMDIMALGRNDLCDHAMMFDWENEEELVN